MNIQGKCVDIEFEIDVPKHGGGSYLGTTLTFKDSYGKVQTKSWVQTALNHASNAHIKAALQTLTKGTCFEAESVKNDKGFWNWTDLKIVDRVEEKNLVQTYAEGVRNETSPGNRSYPTVEERTQTQLHIIRQSSLGHAVNLLKEHTQDINEIIKAAKEFEQHVLGIRISDESTKSIREEPKTLENMENDLV